MTTKIMMGTQPLLALLSQHPEVEAELVSMATEKVAEQWKRKITDKVLETLVSNAERRLNEYIRTYDKKGLDGRSKDLIREFVFEVLDAQAKAIGEAAARTAALAIVEAQKPRLEKMLADFAQAQLAALEGRIELLAEQKVMALLRATAKVAP